MSKNTGPTAQVLDVALNLKRFDINQVKPLLPDLWLGQVRSALKALQAQGKLKVVAKRKSVKIPGVPPGRKLNVYEVQL